MHVVLLTPIPKKNQDHENQATKRPLLRRQPKAGRRRFRPDSAPFAAMGLSSPTSAGAELRDPTVSRAFGVVRLADCADHPFSGRPAP